VAQQGRESDPENLISFTTKAAVFHLKKLIQWECYFLSVVETSGISLLQIEDVMSFVFGLE
jgi:hypothetical protein